MRPSRPHIDRFFGQAGRNCSYHWPFRHACCFSPQQLQGSFSRPSDGDRPRFHRTRRRFNLVTFTEYQAPSLGSPHLVHLDAGRMKRTDWYSLSRSLRVELMVFLNRSGWEIYSWDMIWAGFKSGCFTWKWKKIALRKTKLCK